MIKSMRMRNIEKMIDKVIGNDEENQEMNLILKMIYTDTIDENILKDIDKKREEDLKYINERFTIVIDKPENKLSDNNIKDE
jgi:hypothetical protein